jgi:hypothetical protein
MSLSINENTTFAEMVRMSWKNLLVPVLGPIIIFTLSFFVTNIGWRAIPMALLAASISGGLTLLGLYNRWYFIRGVMRDIRANAEKNGTKIVSISISGDYEK